MCSCYPLPVVSVLTQDPDLESQSVSCGSWWLGPICLMEPMSGRRDIVTMSHCQRTCSTAFVQEEGRVQEFRICLVCEGSSITHLYKMLPQGNLELLGLRHSPASASRVIKMSMPSHLAEDYLKKKHFKQTGVNICVLTIRPTFIIMCHDTCVEVR